MTLSNSDFDKYSFMKRLESINYLMLSVPLVFFGWVFLEKERVGSLRSEFWSNPDLMFHAVMLVGIGYIYNRTLLGWKSTIMKGLEQTRELDLKLKKMAKPIIWRNALWAIGGMISSYGLYEKGDMFYAIFFTSFLILITANRPSGHYFVKFFNLKGEEKKWMLKQDSQK